MQFILTFFYILIYISKKVVISGWILSEWKRRPATRKTTLQKSFSPASRASSTPTWFRKARRGRWRSSPVFTTWPPVSWRHICPVKCTCSLRNEFILQFLPKCPKPSLMWMHRWWKRYVNFFMQVCTGNHIYCITLWGFSSVAARSRRGAVLDF